jgi:hypothetical protein
MKRQGVGMIGAGMRMGSAHYPTECKTVNEIMRLSDDRLYAECWSGNIR